MPYSMNQIQVIQRAPDLIRAERMMTKKEKQKVYITAYLIIIKKYFML